MKKILLIYFLFCCTFLVFSQEEEVIEENSYEYVEYGIDYIQKREIKENLSEKYSGKDFQYQEYEAPEPVKKPSQSNINLTKGILNFFATVFPYLLAILVIFIIVKSVLAGDTSLWNFKKKKIVQRSVNLTQEETTIDSDDYEQLLKIAKQQGNFRKATRFYYLLLLKKMTEKELIKYDNDKTNSEYIFDLKKVELRKPFSYLLYLYDYVWYGEFAVDATSFQAIEDKYQSFLKQL
ncbi:hypothetical protein [Tenacibaculum amylolyticum]|uniref:hypothetical protein n=1 Tax=Tenacibaculum amylolyticum TaxID=104269 RepID=UPI0038961B5B